MCATPRRGTRSVAACLPKSNVDSAPRQSPHHVTRHLVGSMAILSGNAVLPHSQTHYKTQGWVGTLAPPSLLTAARHHSSSRPISKMEGTERILCVLCGSGCSVDCLAEHRFQYTCHNLHCPARLPSPADGVGSPRSAGLSPGASSRADPRRAATLSRSSRSRAVSAAEATNSSPGPQTNISSCIFINIYNSGSTRFRSTTSSSTSGGAPPRLPSSNPSHTRLTRRSPAASEGLSDAHTRLAPTRAPAGVLPRARGRSGQRHRDAGPSESGGEDGSHTSSVVLRRRSNGGDGGGNPAIEDSDIGDPMPEGR
ncbi:hypothetical protein GQ53DRAFT_854062 [Thozetella sp. PMI_491]|nr:hypothetical protein GQ53DRAFT_854062 [Thozetella sp. PMI_491]